MTDVQNAVFTDPNEARAALEAVRWPNGPVCPHCGSTNRIVSGHGKSHRPGLYRCGNCTCQFTVTVHTMFEGTKIPLNKWWLAAHLLGPIMDGVSINQLHRDLGVTYKTARFMAQRLHEALKDRHLALIREPIEPAKVDADHRVKLFPATKSKASALPVLARGIMLALVNRGAQKENSPNGRQKAHREAAPPKRKHDPRSTREAILEVACDQLAKDGHEGLSLTEVAQLAGVNRGTAYRHFKTREKLVKATTDWVSEMLYRAVFGDPADTLEGPIEKIDMPDVNDRLASFALKNPQLCRVWLLQVLASPDPANDLFWREFQGRSERWAKSRFAQPNIDYVVATVITLAGHFLWPLWVQAHFKGSQVDHEIGRRFTNELLRLSMFGSMRPEHYPDIIKRLQPGTP